MKDEANKRAVLVVISNDESVIVYRHWFGVYKIRKVQLIEASISPKPETMRIQLRVEIPADNRVVFVDSRCGRSVRCLRSLDCRERRASHHERPLYWISGIFRRARIAF